MPATIRKLFYPILLFGMLLAVLLAYRAGVRPVYLLLFALTLSVAARLANYPLRHFYRGLQAFQQRDWPNARAHFQTFLTRVERRPWIKRLMWLNWGNYTGDIVAMTHNNLGAIALETRQLDEAKNQLLQAIALDGGYAKPYYNLAVIAALQNDPDTSAQHLGEARRRGFTNSSYDQFLTRVQAEYADFNVSANQWGKPDQPGSR